MEQLRKKGYFFLKISYFTDWKLCNENFSFKILDISKSSDLMLLKFLAPNFETLLK